jgi:hypothetical protein
MQRRQAQATKRRLPRLACGFLPTWLAFGRQPIGLIAIIQKS